MVRAHLRFIISDLLLLLLDKELLCIHVRAPALKLRQTQTIIWMEGVLFEHHGEYSGSLGKPVFQRHRHHVSL